MSIQIEVSIEADGRHPLRISELTEWAEDQRMDLGMGVQLDSTETTYGQHTAFHPITHHLQFRLYGEIDVVRTFLNRLMDYLSLAADEATIAGIESQLANLKKKRDQKLAHLRGEEEEEDEDEDDHDW